MTAEEFGRLIEREHDRLELKTGVGRQPMQRSLVAMSNGTGGVILIGVRDDRQVVGHRRTQGSDDDIHAAAFDASNVGRVDITTVSVDGTPVTVVRVSERTDDVASTSDGRVLLRQGGHNRALTPREVAELYGRRARIRFESTDSGVEISEVDVAAGDELAAACGWTDPSVHVDRWRERGLVHDGGNLSIAGALVLTNPARTLGAAMFHVDVRVYDDDSSTSYIRREVFAGPVQRQVVSTTEMILQSLGTEMVITGARRHDVPRLPARVVREVVANAVAHRTYEVDSTPIVIELRPSAVIATSPGTLPETVTIRTLRQAQAPRNHSVIDVLRRLGLAEDSGQGIDVIEDEMRLEILAEPRFSAAPDSFTVTLPLRGLVSATERGWLQEFERAGTMRHDDRAVLVTIAREHTITNSRAREVLGVDSTEARARLQRLRDAGILVQHGSRGRAYYALGTIGPGRTDEQVVLDAARGGVLTNERVRAMTGLDRAGARALLRRLVLDGRLVQHGERRGTYYTAGE